MRSIWNGQKLLSGLVFGAMQEAVVEQIPLDRTGGVGDLSDQAVACDGPLTDS